MDIFDDLDFLGFIKQKLEEEIDFQEKLIENQRNNFYDKQLDYELCKELHTLEKWKDKVSEYIVNLKASRKPKNYNYSYKIIKPIDYNYDYRIMDCCQKVTKILDKLVGDNMNTNSKELLERNQALLEQNQKLLKSNKELVERIEELKLEINLLNEEINKVLKEKRGGD